MDVGFGGKEEEGDLAVLGLSSHKHAFAQKAASPSSSSSSVDLVTNRGGKRQGRREREDWKKIIFIFFPGDDGCAFVLLFAKGAAVSLFPFFSSFFAPIFIVEVAKSFGSGGEREMFLLSFCLPFFCSSKY